MLLSELEERGRRFKLALRAGLPILLLIALVAYTTFFKSSTIAFTLENSFLLGAIIFISIYFIYFLLEQDAHETLLDRETHGFNHRAFEQKLKTSQHKTIALLAIRNLQLIDENYGAQKTDTLLHNTVQRLNQSLKEDGLGKAIIGRRYGAEFLVAIDGKREDLKSALERFVSHHQTINGIDIEYGFSLVTCDNEELETTVTYLKDILSSTKENITSVVPKQKKEIQDLSEMSEIEETIIQGIKHKKLSFLFRPLQNIKTGHTDIYEVAIKLNSHTFGDILPRTYLPIVNRLGLGREYDFAIVQHLTDLLPLLDSHVSLVFNISPFSLRNREFQHKLFDLLDKSTVDTSRLIIELYERKAHHDLSHYFQTLHYIRTKGLRIAIDNFGSSNASMEYMKHFRFDMVKFDRDYVTKLEDKNTHEMLRSLIEMSSNLNITTVAKWVDKESQKSTLEALGINYIQGFGVGKTITEKEFIDTFN